jgi:hypothetical protein
LAAIERRRLFPRVGHHRWAAEKAASAIPTSWCGLLTTQSKNSLWSRPDYHQYYRQAGDGDNDGMSDADDATMINNYNNDAYNAKNNIDNDDDDEIDDDDPATKLVILHAQIMEKEKQDFCRKRRSSNKTKKAASCRTPMVNGGAVTTNTSENPRAKDFQAKAGGC